MNVYQELTQLKAGVGEWLEVKALTPWKGLHRSPCLNNSSSLSLTSLTCGMDMQGNDEAGISLVFD